MLIDGLDQQDAGGVKFNLQDWKGSVRALKVADEDLGSTLTKGGGP
ncbi:MAG: hypothetical protein IPN69_09760 [Acidobacteria bacterium]|nr:hypothetical protein [Acidobacteriota bacterium]MBK8150039.1 hypothetical protein [Acidobacteriota bacterium]MBK8811002.1 hypothetical protein [Acidobacteriota bacterium]